MNTKGRLKIYTTPNEQVEHTEDHLFANTSSTSRREGDTYTKSISDLNTYSNNDFSPGDFVSAIGRVGWDSQEEVFFITDSRVFKDNDVNSAAFWILEVMHIHRTIYYP